MTTTETPERQQPALDADELSMLVGWLEYHRETLALKCAGLTDEQLRTASMPPSGLTLMGLMRHMSEVEQHWFGNVFGGEQGAPHYYTDEDPDGDFHPGPEDTFEEALATWRGEIAKARAHAEGHALDDLSTGTSRGGQHFNLRWIYTHMIEEYARHNGHADLLREGVDGTTGY
ncbi:DinB family protein [Streptomyces sp. NPDC058301]|uniref:DinB family protein n=1 Tax=Streptomyces sp. NPDC058301 TaxID=3346436 RepID=UPI0036E0D521